MILNVRTATVVENCTLLSCRLFASCSHPIPMPPSSSSLGFFNMLLNPPFATAAAAAATKAAAGSALTIFEGAATSDFLDLDFPAPRLADSVSEEAEEEDDDEE
eukprot:TRINITY_DN77887_c0_g1_i1.p4 TRINITY_DN77887_c0_g1~~TRINITY_DN77887_c0_g1_i1.p4  ORF type:complete len:104 (-),score=6.14 TRINITY_DN77887_c0_g1_i1:1095-1406(-)